MNFIFCEAGLFPVKEPDVTVRIPATAADPLAIVIIVHGDGVNRIRIERQAFYFSNQSRRHYFVAVQGEYPVVVGQSRRLIVQHAETFESGCMDYDVREPARNGKRVVGRTGVQYYHFVKTANGIKHPRQMPCAVPGEYGDSNHICY